MTENEDSTSTGEDAQFGSDTERGPETTDGGWAFITQSHYDPATTRDITTVIVEAIADAEGVSVTEVLSPPLYEVIDAAAIETALFGRPDVSEDSTESTVEFRYNEYKIEVKADGWVTVSTRADE
ncbi:HalOD1 output domain-containing protein [Haloarcula brevis]|uniref:HalOD1 output domain-containing protein n=1 Tax=Haloarcula brevis TaxID=3111453 RepID=UPI00300E7613